MLTSEEFEKRCEDITNQIRFAMGWQWNFVGAAYSTRLYYLKEHLQKIIVQIDKLLEDDKSVQGRL